MRPNRRIRSRRTLLAGGARMTAATSVLVLTAAMAAGLAAGAAAPPTNVAPTKWADRACTAVESWNTELASATPAAPASDPAAARAALSGSLSQSVIATDTIVRALKAAGSPAVPDGPAVARTLRSAFSAVGRRLTGAVSTAGALPTTDTAAFNRGATALGAELQNAIADVDKALSEAQRKYPSKLLDRAFARAPACLSASGAAAAPKR